MNRLLRLSTLRRYSGFTAIHGRKYRNIRSIKGGNPMTKSEIIAAYAQHEGDTGSPEVQIALLTKKINALTEHMKANKKDFATRRGLLQMVSDRRSLLDYLKRLDLERYAAVIKKLGIRK